MSDDAELVRLRKIVRHFVRSTKKYEIKLLSHPPEVLVGAVFRTTEWKKIKRDYR